MFSYYDFVIETPNNRDKNRSKKMTKGLVVRQLDYIAIVWKLE